MTKRHAKFNRTQVVRHFSPFAEGSPCVRGILVELPDKLTIFH
jgi:hypothetical protein